ncbi:MAG: ComF family protein [Immundisolibacter sp.]|uniref:ComF family protein n=1 Tax=Immundisolibacter sp. TaxID=1934948 RepID=UPI00198C8335|nr:ComF family protein [Immundisolibacter sp.]MBC7162587.1 ComF family protein [Immundisolibacter sp.]
MNPKVDEHLDALLAWLLPPQCTLCGAAGSERLPLCDACRGELPYLGRACERCAQPLPVAGVCGRCLRHPPPQDRAHAAFHYAAPLDRLVQRLKFGRRLGLARLTGALLAKAAQSGHWERPELLIPVPLHDRRLRQRGYDQAQAIAREAGRRLGIPVDAHACRRIRATAPQTGLALADRRRNVRGAFAVQKPPAVSHVAVVDDVMTTGATAGALALALKRAGVARVDVWALCRAGR